MAAARFFLVLSLVVATASVAFAQTSPAAAPAAQAASPAIGVDPLYVEGYNAGYSAGGQDLAASLAANAHKFTAYQQGVLAFQNGFSDGYSDAYRRRPSAIGPRAAALPDIVVHEGTMVQATLVNTINTKTSHSGDKFDVAVTVPVWVGAVQAIPAGSIIHGHIASIERGNIFGSGARLQLVYETIDIPAQGSKNIGANTKSGGNPTSGDTVGDEGQIKAAGADVKKAAGVGGGVGAVVGGIFGGVGGAIRGAITGAAFQSTSTIIGHSRDLILAPGAAMTVELQRPIELPAPESPASGGL